MAVGSIVARILTQYSDKGSKAAQKDINKLGKNIDAFAKKTTRAFGLAAVASAAFAVKVGKDAVDAAIADQKSQALLANSLRNTTGATDLAIAGVETYVTALQKQFSVVDDDLRPAMASLVAVTGSVTAAQTLMQTALDISANRGVDLATAVNAITKATRGQYKGLASLVPGLDAATLATKDFGKILDVVSKLTSGSAAQRAQTLEYRLMGLKIAYGEVLETLGYALLPVIERFVSVVTTKVLPALETWIATNKDRLAASFQVAAEFAVKFLTVAIAFGDWIANNMGLVKGMTILIAGMFAVGRIAAFVTAIMTINTAMQTLRATALGAAIAMGFATGGTSAIAGAVAATAITAAIGVSYAANKYGASLRKAGGTSSGGSKGGSRGNANNVEFDMSRFSGGTNALDAFIASLDGATKSTKVAKTLQDRITAEAVRKNLARQATLSGSSTIAIGGSGSLSYGNKGTNVTVNVAGSVSTQEDLVTSIVNGIERTSRRSFGYVGGTKYATR